MIVRLKERKSLDSKSAGNGFNSMIVRLKGIERTCGETRLHRFQFYDSPIKSGTGLAGIGCIGTFQFYDSPIKSRSKRQKTLLILNNLSFNYINKLTNKVVEAQR